MIYFTGDIHGEIDIEKLSYKNWSESRNLTSDDYLIIMGDFGLPFCDSDVDENNKPADSVYHYWIKWLATKPYTILWIDGNHENFNYWEKQEISEWHGGKVQIHPHAPNVIHLMRGEVYEIDGMTFFAFGGAMSHDKEYRKPNITWWEQEEATETEILNAWNNLEKYNRNVIEVEGHTDNVPIRYSAKYENNEVLSVYRALAVTDQLRKNKNLNPKYIKFAGRGDYIPVADNSTAEGRAQNRRVEIKIYNSFNSNVKENN